MFSGEVFYRISPLVYSFIDGIEKVSWIPQKENEGIRRYYLSMRQGDKRFRAVTDIETLYEGAMFYFTYIGEKDDIASQYSFLLMWLLMAIENIRLLCKQEPSVFCMAMNSYTFFGVSSNEMLMIGDEEKDIQTAKRFG